MSNTRIQTQAIYIDENNNSPHKPLLIGCSGGGGHNAAIEAIRQYMVAKGYVKAEKLPKHVPVLHSEKTPKSNARSEIEKGLYFTHEIPVLSVGIQQVLKRSSLPVLPNAKDISEEVQKINAGNLTSDGEKKPRFYVDMLLDGYDAGYESAAIWNVLQKNDNVEELKKLIKLQPYSDKENYAKVKAFFLTKLKDAKEAGQPYTEVICTQAMSLPALCDAVKEYNDALLAKDPNTTKLKIHQYMTDLPTQGAVHFFNSISQLTPQQCQQMYLYGVNFDENILQYFNINKSVFAGVFSIDPQNNPMVRPGFRNEELVKVSSDNQTKITVQDTSAATKKFDIPVNAKDKVAAIMLGSQAGNDTAEYAVKFAAQGFDKIFVFGGKAPHIQKLLDKILTGTEYEKSYREKLVLLDNQDDQHMASIMVRSDVAVVRGGGLTVMEQMALPHSSKQTILVHTKQDENNNFASGISWEDCNVDELIAHLKKSAIQVRRTSTQEVEHQLAMINAGISLPIGVPALRLIRDHFDNLVLTRPDVYDKSVGSFYSIQDAIRAQNVTALLKAIQFTMNQFNSQLGDNIYIKYLDQLQVEIAREGIANLATQLELLDKSPIASVDAPSYDQADNNILMELDDIEFMPTNAKKLLIDQVERLCQNLHKTYGFKIESNGIAKFKTGDDMEFFTQTKSVHQKMQKNASKMLYNNLQKVIKNSDDNSYTIDMAIEAVTQYINIAKAQNESFKPNSLTSSLKSGKDKLERILNSFKFILNKMFPDKKVLNNERKLSMSGKKF